MLLVSALCTWLLLYLPCLNCLELHAANHWAGGFQVNAIIPVCHDVNSWVLDLIFDQPVATLEAWEGTVKQVNDTTYTLTSKEYNGQKKEGEKIELSFIGHGSGSEDLSPGITAILEGCGSHLATLPPGQTWPVTTPTPPPKTGGGSASKDYGDALGKSILFYDAQRSGKLPANNPIHWRGDSALDDCVVGGWYDAGDHVKFGLPFGASVHLLLWGMHLFKDGYVAAKQMPQAYDMIKWALDYMLGAWDPATKQLVVQIGDGDNDHHFWGRPEDMTMDRPCTKVGPGKGASDIAGEWAASLALGYLVFKDKGDTAYANKLLTAAKSLYTFGKDNPGTFTAGQFYGSSRFPDEMCEGAIWLYRATKDQQYLTDAEGLVTPAWAWALSWDDKSVVCQLLAYEETHKSSYKDAVVGYMKGWLPGGQVTYTPCGLAWRDKWGSNRYAGNTAFFALAAAEAGIETAAYRKWAMEQLNFLLGDNHQDGGCYSFQIGYGTKYPKSPHHRAASCPDRPAPCSEAMLHASGPSPQLLVGALVGGPDAQGNYKDDREDYVVNEVAIDYNSGFQSALAGAMHLKATDNIPPTENKCPCTG